MKKRLAALDGLLEEIGGVITTEEAQNLILKKHFDLINSQLNRYLNTEKRQLVSAYENLYDKYFVSAKAMEFKRNKTMGRIE